MQAHKPPSVGKKNMGSGHIFDPNNFHDDVIALRVSYSFAQKVCLSSSTCGLHVLLLCKFPSIIQHACMCLRIALRASVYMCL